MRVVLGAGLGVGNGIWWKMDHENGTGGGEQGGEQGGVPFSWSIFHHIPFPNGIGLKMEHGGNLERGEKWNMFVPTLQQHFWKKRKHGKRDFPQNCYGRGNGTTTLKV